jgi:hypothetical protein
VGHPSIQRYFEKKRSVQRAGDLSGELYADEFQYWPRIDAKRRGESRKLVAPFPALLISSKVNDNGGSTAGYGT